jgi:hypothetical protein
MSDDYPVISPDPAIRMYQQGYLIADFGLRLEVFDPTDFSQTPASTEARNAIARFFLEPEPPQKALCVPEEAQPSAEKQAAAYTSWAAAVARKQTRETLVIEVSCLPLKAFHVTRRLSHLVVAIIHQLVPHVDTTSVTTNTHKWRNGTTERGADEDTRIETLMKVLELVLKMFEKIVIVIGNVEVSEGCKEKFWLVTHGMKNIRHVKALLTHAGRAEGNFPLPVEQCFVDEYPQNTTLEAVE